MLAAAPLILTTLAADVAAGGALELSTYQMFTRMGAALVLSGILGLERERKNRPAGFRTMILIGLGTAGFVIAGQEAIRAAMDASPGHVSTGGADISRVLQGLVGGIGFLGAGAVMQNKKAVRGLTTAAAVWVTACVGVACGLGAFKLAAMLAAMALFTLVVLEIVENYYFPDPGEGGPKDDDAQREGNITRIVLDREGRAVATEEVRTRQIDLREGK